MEEVWQQFITLLTSYSPELAKRFHPGVTDMTVTRAEQRLGITFSEEVHAFFRVQNGSDGPILGSWSFLSLEDLCDDWLEMKARTPMPDAALGRAYEYWEQAFWGWLDEDDKKNPDTGMLWRAYFQWSEDWVPLLRAGNQMRVYTRIDPKIETRDGDLPLSWPPEDLSTTFSAEEMAFYQKTQVYPRHRWSTVFCSGMGVNRLASSIVELLEKLMEQIKEKGYVYDERIRRFRTFGTNTRMLPRVNETPLYELDYDIASAPLKYGNKIVYPGLCCISYERATSEQRAVYQQRSVAQSWDIIVSALQQLAPHIARHLEPGVTGEEIEQAEQRLHLTLPNDVKAWYLLANGRSKQDGFWKFLVDHWHWLPIEYLGWQEWMAPLRVHPPTDITPIRGKFLLSVDARIQPVWKHPQWIPFMIHNQRAVLCIDMAPTMQGQVGQIILSLASAEAYKPWGPLDIRQIPPVIWVAPSLRLFLAALSQDLADGQYTADEYRFLWSQEGLAFNKFDPNDRKLFEDYA